MSRFINAAMGKHQAVLSEEQLPENSAKIGEVDVLSSERKSSSGESSLALPLVTIT